MFPDSSNLQFTHNDNSGNICDGMVTKLSVVSSFDKVKMPPKKKARVDPDATEANLSWTSTRS